MDIILQIILGAIAGWIASIIMKKNKKMGAIANIVVGIIGAFLGGYIMQLLGVEVEAGFNFTSLFVAIFGAVVLLFILGLFSRRR